MLLSSPLLSSLGASPFIRNTHAQSIMGQSRSQSPIPAGHGRGEGGSYRVLSGRGLVMASLFQTDPIKRQRLSTEPDSHSPIVNMSGLPKVNPHLSSLDKDFLYHIGYDSHQCREAFKDVKVCVWSDQGMVVDFCWSALCGFSRSILHRTATVKLILLWWFMPY